MSPRPLPFKPARCAAVENDKRCDARVRAEGDYCSKHGWFRFSKGSGVGWKLVEKGLTLYGAIEVLRGMMNAGTADVNYRIVQVPSHRKATPYAICKEIANPKKVEPDSPKPGLTASRDIYVHRPKGTKGIGYVGKLAVDPYGKKSIGLPGKKDDAHYYGAKHRESIHKRRKFGGKKGPSGTHGSTSKKPHHHERHDD